MSFHLYFSLHQRHLQLDHVLQDISQYSVLTPGVHSFIGLFKPSRRRIIFLTNQHLTLADPHTSDNWKYTVGLTSCITHTLHQAFYIYRYKPIIWTPWWDLFLRYIYIYMNCYHEKNKSEQHPSLNVYWHVVIVKNVCSQVPGSGLGFMPHIKVRYMSKYPILRTPEDSIQPTPWQTCSIERHHNCTGNDYAML